ncbi:MAG: hypothetical protein VXZ05_00265 [Pseudomonadota bacterium]|nr:hypothetical protein [Pseudomonas sp.]MEC8442615.1 hypothetical protein [Pseudomonadota bacterium]
MNKDQLYHQIALACLKTLREGGNAEADDKVKALYKAIDDAFQAQVSLLATELEDARQRLTTITTLDPARHSLQDAIDIAGAQGTAH